MEGVFGHEAAGIGKFAVALAAAALLAWGVALRRGGRPEGHRRLRDALLLALGLLGALAWPNFLQFHTGSGLLHRQDVFHYYIGSKYFDELGYVRLYACSTVAVAESTDGAPAVRSSIRSLESYQLEDAAAVLRDPQSCTRHFSPERWSAFQRDVGWFRKRIPEPYWGRMLQDHGYNPSPVWTAVARPFIRDAPVNKRAILPLLLIDPLLLLGMWLAVWRSFGWRATCVALVFWGTNLPADFGWTGGAFLRYGWFAALTVGICCLHDRRMLAGGALLTTAALLRIFPAAAIGGVALCAGLDLARRRSLALSADHRRFVAGCAAALALLVPLSLSTAGGVRAWGEFADTIRLHAGWMFATNVGMKSFVAYHFDSPEERRRLAPPGEAALTNAVEARAAVYGRYRWIHAAVAMGYFVLLAWALGRRPDWEAAVLGAGAVVMVATMSNYYYVVLLGFALLERGGGAVGAGLCGLAALTWCIAWLADGFDPTFAWISFATVAFVIGATAWQGRAREKEDAGAAPLPA